MELDKLDEVKRLGERRRDLLELFELCGAPETSFAMSIISLKWGDTREVHPLSLISREPIVAAMMNASGDEIMDIDAKLRGLGVMPPRFQHPAGALREPGSDISTAQRAANYWRDQAMMFSHAWSRELGPRRQKAHFIDELAGGTKDLRDKLGAATATVEEYKRAITEAAKLSSETKIDFGVLLGRMILIERDRLEHEKDTAAFAEELKAKG